MLLQKWLLTLPEDSLKRLRKINSSAGSSKHVVLTIAFGLYDRHIRKLNKMITTLLLARMKAERNGNRELVARINAFMDQMHQAIDEVTGIRASQKQDGQPCNRPANSMLKKSSAIN